MRKENWRNEFKEFGQAFGLESRQDTKQDTIKAVTSKLLRGLPYV